MPEKYVFLDRDGVINRDGDGWTEHGYITKWEDFQFLPGVLEAIRELTAEGYGVVVISNQKCVGKGILDRSELDELTGRFMDEVKKKGGKILRVLYCTHLDEDGCGCRKPLPGLFERAADELGIAGMEGFYFVGDSRRDITAGKRAGLRTILVLSGKTSREEALAWDEAPDAVCRDLREAAGLIIRAGRAAGR